MIYDEKIENSSYNLRYSFLKYKIYTYIKQFNYQIALNNFCIMHVC